MRRRRTRRPPRPPELPEAARPPWPPWYAPAALFGSLGATVVLGFPLLPVILLFGISDTLAALALLVLILVQDGVMIGAALLLASMKRTPGPGTSASARLGSGRPPAGPCSASA